MGLFRPPQPAHADRASFSCFVVAFLCRPHRFAPLAVPCVHKYFCMRAAKSQQSCLWNVNVQSFRNPATLFHRRCDCHTLLPSTPGNAEDRHFPDRWPHVLAACTDLHSRSLLLTPAEPCLLFLPLSKVKKSWCSQLIVNFVPQSTWSMSACPRRRLAELQTASI